MIDFRLRAPTLAASTPFAESVVDLAVIASNLQTVRTIARTPLMAVVKADAFGHGAVEVAETVLAGGAEWLGVATIDEALVLRRAGITAPVLAWLVDPRSPIMEAVQADVTVSCPDRATLDTVADAARTTSRRVRVHIELDTGMCRGGASPEVWNDLWRASRSHVDDGSIDVEGIWSHLASASTPRRAAVAAQHRRFVDGVARARAAGVVPRLLHLANSAAALTHPECRFDLIRVGAALYGIETVDGRSYALRSAIRVTSRVLQVRRVPMGSTVGYGGTFRTSKETTLVLVPLGYGDGVPRSLSSGGTVTIGGSRHPIVGTISMDQLVVDVGDHQVTAGDEVVLLGSADAGEPVTQEWATIADTVAHEIVTGLGGRIRRRHEHS